MRPLLISVPLIAALLLTVGPGNANTTQPAEVPTSAVTLKVRPGEITRARSIPYPDQEIDVTPIVGDEIMPVEVCSNPSLRVMECAWDGVFVQVRGNREAGRFLVRATGFRRANLTVTFGPVEG